MVLRLKKFFIIIICMPLTFSSFAKDWYVCLGSYKDQKHAVNQVQSLKNSKIPSFIGTVTKNDEVYYRVFYNYNFESTGDAKKFADKLSLYKPIQDSKTDLWTVKYTGQHTNFVFVPSKEKTKTVEVVKEVPVEKVVLKEVPVVKEVEVVKEVPVVKEVEVIKEVPVEKIVVKEVEVIKEVPVEKIVEVVKTVEVPAAPSVTETPAEEVSVSFAPAVNPEKRCITIKDSDTGEAVADAVISIDDRWSFNTSALGVACIPSDVPDGTYQILISKSDEYVSTEQSVSLTSGELTGSDQFSIPKVVDYDRIKVVLDWGIAPKDLDAHIVCEKDHVSYKNKKAGNIRLDHDATDKYGPETMTVENLDKSKVYSYYVSNYSENYSKSRTLSKSQAQVTVYLNNDCYKTFTPPRDGVGYVWHVFDVVDGKVKPVNTISGTKIKRAKSPFGSDFKPIRNNI